MRYLAKERVIQRRNKKFSESVNNLTIIIRGGTCHEIMEHGIYTWDQATGAFTESASLADTNGEWGFNNTSLADSVIATISSDTLTFTIPGSGVYTATRLVP